MGKFTRPLTVREVYESERYLHVVTAEDHLTRKAVKDFISKEDKQALMNLEEGKHRSPFYIKFTVSGNWNPNEWFNGFEFVNARDVKRSCHITWDDGFKDNADHNHIKLQLKRAVRWFVSGGWGVVWLEGDWDKGLINDFTIQFMSHPVERTGNTTTLGRFHAPAVALEMKTNGMKTLVTNQEVKPSGLVKVFVPLDRVDAEQHAVSTLMHELIHAHQYMSGTLALVWNGDKGKWDNVWKGAVVDTDEVPYRELPWEVEAFDKADLLAGYFYEEWGME